MARSKKIDTHTWQHEGNERTVTIRMTGHNDPKESTHFFAVENDGTEDERRIAENSDVNDLIEEVNEHFKEQYETDWTLWMYVGATRTDHYSNCRRGKGLKLLVDFVSIGETADGEPVYTRNVKLKGTAFRDNEDKGLRVREGDDHKTWDGWWTHNGTPRITEGDPSPRISGRGVNRDTVDAPAFLRATPERVNAIYEAFHAITSLADRLEDLFDAEDAEKTLHAISQGKPPLPPGVEGD